MLIAETFAGNQWPAKHFLAVMEQAAKNDGAASPALTPEQIRGAVLADMLLKVTPAGNA